MDADHLVVFLNRTEEHVGFWALLAPAAPDDGVAAQPIAKILCIDLVEYLAEVEKAAFFGKGKLPLHGHFGDGNFAFARSHWEGGRFGYARRLRRLQLANKD